MRSDDMQTGKMKIGKRNTDGRGIDGRSEAPSRTGEAGLVPPDARMKRPARPNG